MKTSEEVVQPSPVAMRQAASASSQRASRISVPYRMWGARSYFSTTWAMYSRISGWVANGRDQSTFGSKENE